MSYHRVLHIYLTEPCGTPISLKVSNNPLFVCRNNRFLFFYSRFLQNLHLSCRVRNTAGGECLCNFDTRLTLTLGFLIYSLDLGSIVSHIHKGVYCTTPLHSSSVIIPYQYNETVLAVSCGVLSSSVRSPHQHHILPSVHTMVHIVYVRMRRGLGIQTMRGPPGNQC